MRKRGELIDCDKERERFDRLLQLRDEVRVLTITARSGSGKSELLKSLDKGGKKQGAAVALVDLATTEAPYRLVKELAKKLRWQVPLPQFEEKDRLFSASGTVSVTVEGSSFANATSPAIAGQLLQFQDVRSAPEDLVRALREHNRPVTEEDCVDAFCEDLVDASQSQTVVLLFDTWNHCPADLSEWLNSFLLRRQFFDVDRRPRRLALVVAGTEQPDFYASKDEVARVVAFEEIKHWGAPEVTRAAELQGMRPHPKLITSLCNLAELGVAPKDLLFMLHQIGTQGRPV